MPDVPWVLVFYEDYAPHAAYWRSVYGIRHSKDG